MKKLYIITIALIVIGCAAAILSCKKNNNADGESGCVTGGFDPGISYMFWVSKDYGGGIYTVTVTDKDGASMVMQSNKLSVYNSAAPDACNTADANYSKHALAALTYGRTFTYKAVSSNRTYTGTITVPCHPNYTCQSIQIDQ